MATPSSSDLIGAGRALELQAQREKELKEQSMLKSTNGFDNVKTTHPMVIVEVEIPEKKKPSGLIEVNYKGEEDDEVAKALSGDTGKLITGRVVKVSEAATENLKSLLNSNLQPGSLPRIAFYPYQSFRISIDGKEYLGVLIDNIILIL